MSRAWFLVAVIFVGCSADEAASVIPDAGANVCKECGTCAANEVCIGGSITSFYNKAQVCLRTCASTSDCDGGKKCVQLTSETQGRVCVGDTSIQYCAEPLPGCTPLATMCDGDSALSRPWSSSSPVANCGSERVLCPKGCDVANADLGSGEAHCK